MNMNLMRSMVLIFVISSFWFEVEGGHDEYEEQKISYGFYKNTCPQVEDIVRAGIQSISISDPTSPAALLRLMFHDCQVQGCDASILIDPSDAATSSEMDSSKNFGVRKRESISLLKSMVETVCPRRVSCADILILAAREAVAVAGGPRIPVMLGRRDSASPPSYKLADVLIPPANLAVDGMLRIFGEKGMSIEESVALIGAHTLGISHCFNVFSRLQSGQLATGKMEPGLEAMLRLSCPLGSFTPNTSFVANDPTSLLFDNRYYVNAITGRGILTVDAQLPSDPRTAPYVRLFAADQDAFFRAFSSAFLKLSSSGVLTGDQGVIRASCSVLS